MNGPERIWATPSDDGWMAPYVGNAPCEGAVEYVRADLATPAAPPDGGPAYPVMWEYADNETGMSLHDAAVLAALPVVMQTCGRDTCDAGETYERMFVRKARGIADAMIAARGGE